MGKNQKKFRLHIHQNLSISVSAESKLKPASVFSMRSFFVSALLKIFKSIYEFCYFIGNAIIKFSSLAIIFSKNEVFRTKQFFLKRIKILAQPEYFKTLAVFTFVLIVSILGLQSFKIVAKGLEIKQSVLGITAIGNKYMLGAKKSLEKQNIGSAEDSFIRAYNAYKDGQKQLSGAENSINLILGLFPQKKDAENLLKAASLVSQSGAMLTSAYQDISSLKFNATGISSDRPVPEVFESLDNSLSIVGQNLETAGSLLKTINLSSIPKNQQPNFLELESGVNALKLSLSNTRDMFSIIKNLSMGKQRILMLFENNNELRATGGFMGTFGDIQVSNGVMEKIKISSIYDLDGQLEEKIMPPNPLLAVNGRWFLRDANWFSDFSFSAKKIIGFYEKEGGETPDTVIAMTPSLIVDMLKITGPVNLPAHGVSLDSDNFIEQTQIATSADEYRQNTPKQVLADFVPVFLQKISNLKPQDYPAVLEVLQKNLNGKQILAYSRNPLLQKKLEEYHWAGQIFGTDRDFLSVVSSNLGGTKTDLYTNQQINLKSTIDSEGYIVNELQITRTNSLPKLEDTNNNSFIRIYVPKGSTLISNLGFDYKNLDNAADKAYKTDADVHEWEKNSVKDLVSGMLIGTESGKTYFGNWLNVEGGETKTAKLSYRLPFKIKDIDHYSLLIQKQAGAIDQSLSYELDFPDRSIAWKNFSDAEINQNKLNTEIILNKDYLLGLVLNSK